MRTTQIGRQEWREAFAVVARLYPHIPSIALWRSWELAAYRHCSLLEPVLDVGCGDGQFFRTVWPTLRDVVGVDFDPAMVAAARASGVYREVVAGSAQTLAVRPGSFASAFANCSLEHMQELDLVLRNIGLALRPGGTFLLSVVTDKFEAWQMLPLLARKLGAGAVATRLQAEYREFAAVRNPLPPAEWQTRIERAGFGVEAHFPIAPEITSRLFLLLDELWHVRAAEGELGTVLHRELAQLPAFPQAFGRILDAVLDLERDPGTCSGAVFLARRLAGPIRGT